MVRYLWLCVIGDQPQPYARSWRSKPKVQATGNLAGVLEWTPMDAIRPLLDRGEDVLGTALDIRHKAPVFRGATLHITAECVWSMGMRSRWQVNAGYFAGCDFRVAAEGIVSFSIVGVADFLQSTAPHAWARWRAKPRWRHRVYMWAIGQWLPRYDTGKHHARRAGAIPVDCLASDCTASLC